MKAAADGLVLFLLTVVVVWTLVFGVSAAVIARRAGRSSLAWFVMGALAGPVALGALWWVERNGSRAPTRAAQVLGPDSGPGQASSSSYFDL